MLYVLDLGANDGCSIRKLKSEYLQNVSDYQLLSFEPHPFFFEKLEREKTGNIHVYPKAISTCNTTVKFFYSKKCDGSSLNSCKTTNGIEKSKYFEVETIDICDVIKNLNLKYSDKLWIKMDIEGEEYEIIPHLEQHNMIQHIDVLFIEWHYGKLSNITKEQHESCVKKVKDIHVQSWDALNYTNINRLDSEYKAFMQNLLIR